MPHQRKTFYFAPAPKKLFIFHQFRVVLTSLPHSSPKEGTLMENSPSQPRKKGLLNIIALQLSEIYGAGTYFVFVIA